MRSRGGSTWTPCTAHSTSPEACTCREIQNKEPARPNVCRAVPSEMRDLRLGGGCGPLSWEGGGRTACPASTRARARRPRRATRRRSTWRGTAVVRQPGAPTYRIRARRHRISGVSLVRSRRFTCGRGGCTQVSTGRAGRTRRSRGPKGARPRRPRTCTRLPCAGAVGRRAVAGGGRRRTNEKCAHGSGEAVERAVDALEASDEASVAPAQHMPAPLRFLITREA